MNAEDGKEVHEGKQAKQDIRDAAAGHLVAYDVGNDDSREDIAAEAYRNKDAIIADV